MRKPIDLSQNIIVRHCSIYDLPRSGINIGDGCWGGHVIKWCDIFDTVKETGDHGAFNSWGRDRFWWLNVDEVNAWVKQAPELPLLDVVKPIMLVNNRWRYDHGWTLTSTTARRITSSRTIFACTAASRTARVFDASSKIISWWITAIICTFGMKKAATFSGETLFG